MVFVRAPLLLTVCVGALLINDAAGLVACKYGVWKYELCNKDTGLVRKTRVLLSGPSTICTETIGKDDCDVDCVMEFRPWSECVDGTQNRMQIKTAEAKNNGLCAAPRTETRSCLIDCVMDYPADVSTIPCDRNTGLRTIAQQMVTPPQVGGKACPAAQIKTETCDVDCVKIYPEWDLAIHQCNSGTGTKTRKQIVVAEGRRYGTSCGNLQEESVACDVDCELEYPNWNGETCDPDTGLQQHTEQIKTNARNGGKANDKCLEEAETEYRKCPVDCVVEWGPESECDRVTGVKKKSQYVTVQPKNGGKKCPALQFNTTSCAINCEMKFPAWDPLVHQCEKTTGQRTRKEEISVLPNALGTACPEPKKEVLDCPVNCEMKMPAWSNALHPCDPLTGLQTRTEIVAFREKNGGSLCPKPQTETRACKVDCKLSKPEWIDVPCNKATGLQTRTETKVVDPKNGGAACVGAKTETQPCPVHCENKFPDWDPTVHLCDKKTGLRTRTEVTAIYAKNGGTACPKARSDVMACAVDCELTWPEWDSNFHPCDKNTGLRTRKQTPSIEAQNSGRNCPIPAVETIKCPVDCETNFPDWDSIPCSITNTRTRAQVPIISAKNGGRACTYAPPEVQLCAYIGGKAGNKPVSFDSFDD